MKKLEVYLPVAMAEVYFSHSKASNPSFCCLQCENMQKIVR